MCLKKVFSTKLLRILCTPILFSSTLGIIFKLSSTLSFLRIKLTPELNFIILNTVKITTLLELIFKYVYNSQNIHLPLEKIYLKNLKHSLTNLERIKCPFNELSY